MVNGKLHPYSHIYQIVVATDGNVLHFKTETAREGVEQQRYEEINVWEVNAVIDVKDDLDFDHKTTWFEGEVIREIKFARSKYSQFLGEGVGVEYELDTAIIFYLESGIFAWMMLIGSTAWSSPGLMVSTAMKFQRWVASYS